MKQAQSLIIDFHIKLSELQRISQDQGMEINTYCVLRTCEEQAKIYRMTRGIKEINHTMQTFKDRGLGFLSDILKSVGPQSAPAGTNHRTKAGPGESWHQYLLAADSVPVVNGKAIWEESAPEWPIYGAVAGYVGLTWGGERTEFKDLPHVQAVPVSSPITYFKDPEVIKSILTESGAL
jgi:peptidoglycan L-alanyl-D-glutamate endopeptidase CwlK